MTLGSVFTPVEAVLLAVAEDDVDKFERAITEIGLDNIISH